MYMFHSGCQITTAITQTVQQDEMVNTRLSKLIDDGAHELICSGVL